MIDLRQPLMALTAVAGIACWASTASAANLIDNGGFEDSVEDSPGSGSGVASPHWRNFAPASSFFVKDPAIAAEGDWFLSHSTANGFDVFTPYDDTFIPITPNTDYTFSGKFRTPSDASVIGTANILQIFLSWKNSSGNTVSFETIKIYDGSNPPFPDEFNGQTDTWIDFSIDVTSDPSSSVQFFRPAFNFVSPFGEASTILIDDLQFDVTGAATIAGDYNNSGLVEQGDLDLVLLNWGTSGTPSGWVNEVPVGLVDQAELDGVLLNWGNTSEPAGSAVPEPATAALLGLGALAMLRRRVA